MFARLARPGHREDRVVIHSDDRIVAAGKRREIEIVHLVLPGLSGIMLTYPRLLYHLE